MLQLFDLVREVGEEEEELSMYHNGVSYRTVMCVDDLSVGDLMRMFVVNAMVHGRRRHRKSQRQVGPVVLHLWLSGFLLLGRRTGNRGQCH